MTSTAGEPVIAPRAAGSTIAYPRTVADPAEELEFEELDDVSDDERAELARLWQSEVQRRLAEIDAGTARVVPAGEVMAGIRKLIEERRKV